MLGHTPAGSSFLDELSLVYVDRIELMCLTLYLATRHEQPLSKSSELTVEAVEPAAEAVRKWFSLPVVRFIGADTGCSCGFRYVGAEEPIEYWEGMFDDSDGKQDSTRALVRLIHEHVTATGEVEMYPLWNDEVEVRPKGTIALRVNALDPRTFFFVEGFLYRVHSDPQA
jgi:hypothetical protein